jgi:hypothetical protein
VVDFDVAERDARECCFPAAGVADLLSRREDYGY